MKIQTKIRMEKFFLNLAFELFVNGAIITIAYFLNRIIEILCFYLCWSVFREAVIKVFHFKANKPIFSILGCAICSIACFVVAMRFVLPIGMSIFSSVLLGIWINYILYCIANYRDLLREKSKNTVDVYKMNEDDLRAYARSKGLSEMIVDTLVLKVIYNYRWVEIQNERNYTKDGIRYHKERINKVLNLNI